MGLAASQARFLGLTARKSNVEFQGQQVNQARTALANEVMRLYDKYNKLEVPIPPSIQDYTKTVYNLQNTDENYQLTSFKKILSGEYEGYYEVVLTYNQESAKVYPYTAKDVYATSKKSGDSYSYLSFQIGSNNYYYDENDSEGSSIKRITDNYDKYYGLRSVMEEWGVTEGVFYQIYRNGNYYYTSDTILNDTAWDSEGNYYGDFTFEYQGTKSTEKSVSGVATMTQASDGRPETIKVIEAQDAPADLIGYTYEIATTTQEDQEGYNEAMNKYNYKKDLYEKEVENINKKTEKLQTEDRALELKIAQLDTEHNAIATEMDSVSKVIEDTIESVFKTFQ